MTNPLVELQELGQSIWYDNIRRGLLVSGELKGHVDSGEIRGVTSNPTIFEKAIGGSRDYDGAVRELAREGRSAQEIFDALSIDDIRATADLFRPIYDRSGRKDGFVSIEVSPLLARETRSTIAEAHRLWRAVDRPNLMVKIPATAEGIPAVEQCLLDGLNINITLIFSRVRYAEVMNAFLTALERRLVNGQPIDHIASVASFFVSRVDSKIDPQLETIVRREGPEAARAAALVGKAAIANAKLAYRDFRRTFETQRFARLSEHGAQLQRPLWASTSTKNPAYPDVYYVEALIGPDTVNTVPPQSLEAYRDHGEPAIRITEGVDGAERHLAELEALGLPMSRVTEELEAEGVAAFSKSFESLMGAIDGKRRAMQAASEPVEAPRAWISAQLGELESRVSRRLDALAQDRFLERLWDKDPSLWTNDASHRAEIRERLGWLDVHRAMADRVDELTAFAEEARQAGFTHAALLGMGGSSLCPDVLRQTFGVQDGYPDLAVLDSTDPASVRAIDRRSDPAKTLYIVASKSGSTIEPNAFLAYFWDRARSRLGDRAGENFVAITDPGTKMDRLAEERGFRRIFHNPPDIGGRYSALSYFGLAPAAAIGLDVRELLRRAEAVAQGSTRETDAHDSPGVRLGAILGEAALAGRDKMTLIASKGIQTFGYWVEQLVAESTGKEGKGIVPVVGEPLGKPDVYGNDRLFVYLRLGDQFDRRVRALAKAGHPVVTLELRDAHDLGAQFYLWQVATAVAGSVLRIDPFDQPNVQESKDNTARLLEAFTKKWTLPAGKPVWSKKSAAIFGKGVPASLKDARSLAQAIAAHLGRLRPGDYVAFNAYVPRTPATEHTLRAMRQAVRDSLHAATTAGYGPRFLHSTGQLHKGGPNTAVIIQITADPERDLLIPGEPFTFGVLERAQALGDLDSLAAKKRRVIDVRLPGAQELKTLSGAVTEAAAWVVRGADGRAKAKRGAKPAARRNGAKPAARPKSGTRKRAQEKTTG